MLGVGGGIASPPLLALAFNYKRKGRGTPRQKKPSNPPAKRRKGSDHSYRTAVPTTRAASQALTLARARSYVDKTSLHHFVEPYEEVIAPTESSVVHVMSSNPRSYGNTKVLGRYGAMFMRYCPKSLIIHYYPRCSTMTNGELILGSIFADSDLGEVADDALLASPGGISFLPFEERKIAIPIASLTGRSGTGLWYACQPSPSILSEPFTILLKVNSAVPGTVLGRLELEWTYEFQGLKLGGNDSEDVPNMTLPLTAAQPGDPVLAELAGSEGDTWSWKSLLFETVPKALVNLVKPGIRYGLAYAGAGVEGMKYMLLDDLRQPITSRMGGLDSHATASAAIEYPRPKVEEMLERQSRVIAQRHVGAVSKLNRFLASASSEIRPSTSQESGKTSSTPEPRLESYAMISPPPRPASVQSRQR